jgi:hypothetical protein
LKQPHLAPWPQLGLRLLQAEVVKTGATELRVKMVEGPKSGEQLRRTWKQVLAFSRLLLT